MPEEIGAINIAAKQEKNPTINNQRRHGLPSHFTRHSFNLLCQAVQIFERLSHRSFADVSSLQALCSLQGAAIQFLYTLDCYVAKNVGLAMTNSHVQRELL